MSGSKEAVNELLDFSVERVADDSSLEKIGFDGVKKEVAEIEPEILTVLASKAGNLKSLHIIRMQMATEQVRQAMAVMALDIIQLALPELKELGLIGSGFEGSDGDKICAALYSSNITSLTAMYLARNHSWFSNDDQCSAWA